MTDNNFINILIAEDNEVSREMMAGVLKTQGYNIHGVSDGNAAIDMIGKHDIDMALVDINMAPAGGFEFVKHLVVKGIDLPVVIITSDDSSDILVEASNLGVSKVIQKPVEPDRLVQIVQRVLKRKGLNPEPMGVQAHQTEFSHEELMQRAVGLADKNAQSRKGGPFGAVIADENGKILGEGVNGITSRADPTAHAEVMAIRQAAEKLGKADLSTCVLYCSSEPTMMGKSLVLSVGIQTVYFGLTHGEVSQIRPRERYAEPEYIQMGHDEALEMFKNWEKLDEKIAD